MSDDLISREALKDHISELMLVYKGTEFDSVILNAIDNAPTVEPTFGLFKEMLCAECDKRPTGKWRFYGLCFSTTQYQCNKCEYLTLEKTNFCPNCGADMRGGRE